MKNIILIAISLFIVSTVSGQTLAKKPHHKSAPTVVDQMTVPAFRAYAVEAGKQLDQNDLQISDLRFFLMNLQQDFNSKAVNKIVELQNENNELKTELNNFAKYGEGDWHDFQREFNQDMKLLSSDIDYMHARFLKDYLLAAN